MKFLRDHLPKNEAFEKQQLSPPLKQNIYNKTCQGNFSKTWRYLQERNSSTNSSTRIDDFNPPESLAKQGPITTVETISNSKPSEKAGKTSLKKNLFIFHPCPQSGNCVFFSEIFHHSNQHLACGNQWLEDFHNFFFRTAYFQRQC